MSLLELSIIGGGLAGCEAAWQAAKSGVKVTIYEMRPLRMTGAHKSSLLGELVCSNSLGSSLDDRASGLLKNELRLLKSLLIRCADESAVPAGCALAVDREAFAGSVTRHIENHPNITVLRQEITEIPQSPCIVATGPLTSQKFAEAIARLTGQSHLYFFDAIAPIIVCDSINMEIAFKAARYKRGGEEGDYINCPMSREEYEAFIGELVGAERIPLESFELEIRNGVDAGKKAFFEGCLPIEIMAERGRESLAYGPLRPVGMLDPKTGRRPYAIVQLRQDNLAGDLYNMVGFQTNLRISEQKRVFRMIPGLEGAEFSRFGQMHRNTFIFSPDLLEETLQFKRRQNLFFAGQLTGVEGYVGNIATGLLAGINAARLLKGEGLLKLPATSMLGALCHYITHASAKDFQPMKANFGILPELVIDNNRKMGKQKRRGLYANRALEDLNSYLKELQIMNKGKAS